MKKVLLATLCFVSVFAFAATVERDSVERRKAIAKTLYGRIRIVEFGEDYRLRLVNGGEDLRVRKVKAAACDVGLWEVVEFGEDYRVRFVSGGEDLTIRFVTGGEGVAD